MSSEYEAQHEKELAVSASLKDPDLPDWYHDDGIPRMSCTFDIPLSTFTDLELLQKSDGSTIGDLLREGIFRVINDRRQQGVDFEKLLEKEIQESGELLEKKHLKADEDQERLGWHFSSDFLEAQYRFLVGLLAIRQQGNQK